MRYEFFRAAVLSDMRYDFAREFHTFGKPTLIFYDVSVTVMSYL